MTAHPPCLLCKSTSEIGEHRWTIEQIEKLYAVIGIDVRGVIFPGRPREAEISLLRCTACGFGFFDPELAGDGAYYAAIDRGEYYSVDRPEFQFTLEKARARKIETALDYGCGDGAFLNQARAAGMKTSGVEINEKAARKAQEAGHRMLSDAELGSGAYDGAFDLVTLFQVLEHVKDPVAKLRECRKLVKPGGYLVAAVPSALRLYGLCSHDPMNIPPHHVSWWREQDLAKALELGGFEIKETGADQIYGRELKEFWLLDQKLRRALGESVSFPPFLISAVSLLYRGLGLKHWLPHRGLSIYAMGVAV